MFGLRVLKNACESVPSFVFQEAGIEVLGSRVRLHGHKDSITCIELCQAFSIVVSGSRDRTAIIWDLNRYYI